MGIPGFVFHRSKLYLANRCSVYKQIGPGQRIALSKLAIEHLEKTGRPLRIAIDISIWQFQIQSGQGGKNPALRTLYYRLLKLRALSIQALFVFDGPKRPTFKRNVEISPYATHLETFLIKQLLKLFGFPSHDAPGEAEAECALLQKEGIVDAVLSEDVDTLMFGCTVSLRNWTAEGAARGNKSATHINIYKSEAIKDGPSGLDREGMILVALMSGGDYMTEGIQNCGPKTASEAARAGFGRDLCRLSMEDSISLREWRRRLEHELVTNESKMFKRKHGAIKIPETFPDKTIFVYYIQPVVSSPDKVSRLRNAIPWDNDVNIPELRLFVAEAFNWPYLVGAKHFIRGLAPALLVQKLVQVDRSDARNGESIEIRAAREARLVKTISGRRNNWINDGEPELRLSYIPAEIVGLDLSAEEQGGNAEGKEEGDDAEAADSGHEIGDRSRSPRKRPFTYDPTQIEKLWVLETIVKLGAPLLVETWEEEMQSSKKFATRKIREKKALSKAVANQGSIDQYLKIGKPKVVPESNNSCPAKEFAPNLLPPTYLAPAIAKCLGSPHRKAVSVNTTKLGKPPLTLAGKPKFNVGAKKNIHRVSLIASQVSTTCHEPNPWTLSKRPSDTFGILLPSRYSALGIYGPGDPETALSSAHEDHLEKENRAFVTQRTPMRLKKHTRPPSPPEAANRNQIDEPPSSEGPASPSRYESSKPSPNKKRSPLQVVNPLNISSQLRTPTTMRGRKYRDKSRDNEDLKEEPLTLGKVNRLVEFDDSTKISRQSPSASDSSSLPSPSALLSPPATPSVAAVKIDNTSTLVHEPHFTKAVLARKLIAVRESLEGAWKHLDAEEARSNPTGRVYSGVEFVDMTVN